LAELAAGLIPELAATDIKEIGLEVMAGLEVDGTERKLSSDVPVSLVNPLVSSLLFV